MAARAGQTTWSWLKPALTAWLGVGVVVAAVTLLWWSTLPAVARDQALALWQAHGAMVLALAVLTLPLAAWVAHRRWRQQHAWRHATLTDALRLSRGMTYKSALAGLPYGGGKSVIIGDPKTGKTEALFRAMGRFV
ncbi:MAG: Glu/Leu/Phe/Val dehydrogenase dimerization domain-containing protein, partial [Burkholderiaceae bacterium]